MTRLKQLKITKVLTLGNRSLDPTIAFLRELSKSLLILKVSSLLIR
jgi:hypothetical protein